MSDATARSWALPNVAGPVISGRSRSTSAASLSEHLRAEHSRVFDDARRQGFEAGQAACHALRDQLAAETARLQETLQQLARPLLQLDQQLLDELTQLALSVGKQLARRELHVEPAQVAAIVREAIGLLPSNSREVRVFLHPADAAVLRDRLAPASVESAWQILEDPVLTRGGCRVESEYARIDSRFESSVSAIASALLEPKPSAT